jgi:hypothetical protein
VGISSRVATWAEREPEVFIGRRKDDGDRRFGERRRPERRAADRRCATASIALDSSSHIEGSRG